MARTGAGEPWTNLNQGQKIMFGGVEAVVVETTGTAPIARCRTLGTLEPFTAGAYEEGLWADTFLNQNLTDIGQPGTNSVNFNYRQCIPLPTFWITSNREVVTLSKSPYSVPGVIYKGKLFQPQALPLRGERFLEVNVFQGRIWACCSGLLDIGPDPAGGGLRKYIQAIRLLTCLVTDSHLVELDRLRFDTFTGIDFDQELSSGRRVTTGLYMAPAFNYDCSNLKCGAIAYSAPTVFPTPETYLARVREYTLTPGGTIGGYSDYDWDAGFTPISARPADLAYTPIPDHSAISNNKVTFLPYPTRANNATYTVGQTVHKSYFEAAYAVVTTAGTTATSAPWNFFQIFISNSGVDTITDGTVVWQRGSGYDTTFQNSEETWPIINVSAEHAPSGEQKTLDEILDEIGVGDPLFSHYELLEGPTEFLDVYPRRQYYASYAEMDPHPFRRSAKVRIWKYPPEGSESGPDPEPEPTEGFIYSYRWAPHYESDSIGGGSSPPSVYTHIGDKPLGWVRNIDTGMVEEVVAKPAPAPSIEGSASGVAGGLITELEVYGPTTVAGATSAIPPPLSVMEGFCNAAPDPQGYGYSWSITQNGMFLEQVYIGDEPQYAVGGCLPRDSRVSEVRSASGSATLQKNDLPSTPVSVWSSYKNVSENNSGVVSTYRLGSQLLVAGNLQARFYYLASHYHDTDISTSSPPNTASHLRERRVMYQGSVLWSEEYQAATSARNDLLYPASNNAISALPLLNYSYIVPVKRGSNIGFILVVKDFQGEERNQWGEIANVTPGRYTIMIDSNGWIYNSVPLEGGGYLPIDESYNDSEEFLFLHIK